MWDLTALKAVALAMRSRHQVKLMNRSSLRELISKIWWFWAQKVKCQLNHLRFPRMNLLKMRKLILRSSIRNFRNFKPQSASKSMTERVSLTTLVVLPPRRLGKPEKIVKDNIRLIVKPLESIALKMLAIIWNDIKIEKVLIEITIIKNQEEEDLRIIIMIITPITIIEIIIKDKSLTF